MAGPDLAGFRDAMREMRDEMGTTVSFLVPGVEDWPDGTPIDPETLRPYDPTIEPNVTGGSSIDVQADVYTQPVPGSFTDNVSANPVGWFEEGNAIIDIDVADYPPVQDATLVEWNDETWEITDTDSDGIGNVVDRMLIFVRQK